MGTTFMANDDDAVEEPTFVDFAVIFGVIAFVYLGMVPYERLKGFLARLGKRP